jgi:hypothetical protein
VLCAFAGTSAFALNLVLGARLRPVETLFGGLDRMYRVHRINGRVVGARRGTLAPRDPAAGGAERHRRGDRRRSRRLGRQRVAAGTSGAVFALDLRTGAWSRLPDLPTPRHGLGVVAFGRDVDAIGGGPQPGLTVTGANERLALS